MIFFVDFDGAVLVDVDVVVVVAAVPLLWVPYNVVFDCCCWLGCWWCWLWDMYNDDDDVDDDIDIGFCINSDIAPAAVISGW